MRTLVEISRVLTARLLARRYPKLKLAADAGITYRTLSHVLSGEQDYKVSTLLTVADRLGLEVMLVPNEATGAMTPPSPEPEVKSRVQAALDRLEGGKK